MKSIGIPEEIHKRIKIVSAMTGKTIKKLIEESAVYLEKKYSEGSKQESKM